MSGRELAAALVAVVVAGTGAGCDGGAEETAAERGRRAYRANCIACHNLDPTLEGVMGPAIAGSTLLLVEARVVRAEYPPGYAPKRESALMPAQPFLADQVPDLVAYLSSVESSAASGFGGANATYGKAAGTRRSRPLRELRPRALRARPRPLLRARPSARGRP